MDTTRLRWDMRTKKLEVGNEKLPGIKLVKKKV